MEPHFNSALGHCEPGSYTFGCLVLAVAESDEFAVERLEVREGSPDRDPVDRRLLR